MTEGFEELIFGEIQVIPPVISKMPLIKGFEELKIILDEIKCIPPLANIIVEYSKCCNCHNAKQCIIQDGRFEYMDTSYPNGRSYVYPSATDAPDIYCIRVPYHPEETFKFTGHVDVLAYYVAHQLLSGPRVNDIPYHTL